jgi:hypothetical protein
MHVFICFSAGCGEIYYNGKSPGQGNSDVSGILESTKFWEKPLNPAS